MAARPPPGDVERRRFLGGILRLIAEIREHLRQAVRYIRSRYHRSEARAHLGVVNHDEYRYFGIVGGRIRNARAYTGILVGISYLFGGTGFGGYLVSGNIAVLGATVARNAAFKYIGYRF